MPAGDADTASAATMSRTSVPRANQPAAQYTSPNVSADSTRPTASTQGL